MAEFKSGFISVIGRPNVGKSTLVNRVVQQKIAITSDKAQTTRNRVSGIYTDEDKQLVFIDTPGIHKPKNRLGTIMNENALSTLNEVDVVLFMVNATEKRGPGDNFIMERLEEVQVPIFLIINKMDEVPQESFPEIVGQYQDTLDFKEIFPLSAKEGTNVDRLVEVLTGYLDEGPQYFPEDQVSDHPERFLVKEIIREKVLDLTREEVPHSVAVTVEDMSFNEDGKMEIDATIVVERSSQKGIIIGKGGQMLKKIGTGARREIEGLLGEKVRLNLWVRVKENWRDRDHLLKNFGYYSEND